MYAINLMVYRPAPHPVQITSKAIGQRELSQYIFICNKLVTHIRFPWFKLQSYFEAPFHTFLCRGTIWCLKLSNYPTSCANNLSLWLDTKHCGRLSNPLSYFLFYHSLDLSSVSLFPFSHYWVKLSYTSTIVAGTVLESPIKRKYQTQYSSGWHANLKR